MCVCVCVLLFCFVFFYQRYKNRPPLDCCCQGDLHLHCIYCHAAYYAALKETNKAATGVFIQIRYCCVCVCVHDMLLPVFNDLSP